MELKPLFDTLVPEEQPPSRVDVKVAIQAGRRLRHRRRALAILMPVGAAAATALVLATGSLTAPGRQDVATSPSPTRTDALRPAAEVWPSAVTTIPAKAADGSTYRPVTAMSATELLLRADKSPLEGLRLEVYDTARRKATVLGKIPDVRAYSFPQGIELGPTYILWWATALNAHDAVDLWVLPRTGGTAAKVARISVPPTSIDRIGVSGDRVVWSVKKGGLYSVPISGGPARAMPGTDGLHLVSWPWADDTGQAVDRQANQRVLVNLETGKRTPLRAPQGVKQMRCAPTWCVGMQGEHAMAWRRDGGRPQPLRGALNAMFSQIRRDRFVNTTGLDVYDLTTGQGAEIGPKAAEGVVTISMGFSSSLVISWDAPPCANPCRQGKAPELVVLNLAAVPG
ncbi:hypothetical protein [Nonomuraea guangzhouensis]|uniref:Uncharacterized protein n=1 Tax=Nonomuraea guangzhouensis TaxID=1291555 RepID=A0ABW4GQ33_9ACTN|nr:hypothetical protein [Nonomuraea guangzhouensis]